MTGVAFSIPCRIVLPLLALPLVGLPSRASGQAPASASGVNTVFDLQNPVVLEGSRDVPLYSAASPLVTSRYIIVPDYVGHRLIVFNTRGQFQRLIGKRGGGPGEFQLPFGIVADDYGRLYVNDRGNQRVQILDTAFRYVGSVLTSGQNEEVFLRPGKERQLVVQGVARCREADGCLVVEYDEHGREVASYAPTESNTVIATWKAAMAVDGSLYLANVLGDRVRVFSPVGKLKGVLEVGSPSRIAFRGNAPTSSSQMAGVLLRLKKERYTQLRRLVVAEGNVFVQYQVVNPQVGDQVYRLDVFREDGCPRHQGIATPGLLTASRSGLFFVRQTDSGYGSVTIRPARARIRPTEPCGT